MALDTVTGTGVYGYGVSFNQMALDTVTGTGVYGYGVSLKSGPIKSKPGNNRYPPSVQELRGYPTQLNSSGS